MIDITQIAAAAKTINPVFLHTPQYQSEALSNLFGFSIICKIETINPLGCFKGRGADWWIKSHKEIKKLVCVSAGNFGLALAYSGRQNGTEVHVFCLKTANPMKIKAIVKQGAKVHLMEGNYDIIRDSAEKFAKDNDCYFIVDGKEQEITEGAGTIGLELSQYPSPIEALYIPIGDAALINGVGTWYKAKHPSTRIIGVCAKGAPAMYESWKKGSIASTDSQTIADGIAINTPILESFEELKNTVDDIILVDDTQIIESMHLLYEHEHLVTEPAGAAAFAGLMHHTKKQLVKTAAFIVTGANVDPLKRDQWLQGKL